MFMAELLRLYQLEVLTGVYGPKYTTYLRMPYVLNMSLKFIFDQNPISEIPADKNTWPQFRVELARQAGKYFI